MDHSQTATRRLPPPSSSGIMVEEKKKQSKPEHYLAYSLLFLAQTRSGLWIQL
jgi:hypothetical protein